MPPVAITLEMPREMALSLVGALQIMARQDVASPGIQNMITDMGRSIQAHVCDSPELYAITDSGWPARGHTE